MTDIFLSYNREDQATARLFAEAFAREGFDVWWDVTLRSGEAYDEVTEAALRGAKAVVVLWSPRSVNSRWVRAEATIADRNRVLVPATIEPCERPIMFELTQTADLSRWAGDASDLQWRLFVEDVRGFVERAKAREQAPAAPAPAPAVSAEPGRPSLAIMPFANRSGEAADDVFAAGMVEDLIAALSSVVMIKVISSSATRTYRDVAYDARQVGEELGARYLLEGNVRRMGDNLRVTAQLVEAANGEIRWNGKFDRPLADLAALQEELVTEVAGLLGVQVKRIEIERALRKPGDLTAWEAILKSMALGLQQTPESVRRAIEEARKAVALAPDYARSHGALAMATCIAYWQLSGSQDEALRKEARDAAKRALKLEPDDPAILGGAAMTFCSTGGWAEGLRCAERAFQIAPDHEASHVAMILVCIYFKRPREALDHLDACERLAPRGAEAHIRLIQRSGAYFMLGKYELALQATQQALIFHPTLTFGHKDVVIYLEKMGRRAEAVAALEEFKELMPNVTLEFVERIHRGSLLAPDVALDMYETFAQVWRAAEAGGGQP